MGDSGMMRRDEGVVVVLWRPLGVHRGRRVVAGGEHGKSAFGQASLSKRPVRSVRVSHSSVCVCVCVCVSA